MAYRIPTHYDGKPWHKTAIGDHPMYYVTIENEIICPYCAGDGCCKDLNSEYLIVNHVIQWKEDVVCVRCDCILKASEQ